MIVKTIPSTWLIEEEHRLDCGPFVKGAIETRKKLQALACHKDRLVDLTYGGLSGMYHVGQDKIVWAQDGVHGMPFLRSSDILDADVTDSLFISRKQVSGNSLFQCPEGTTLITRSGTIGRMAYMRPDMTDTAISQDVLKVIPDGSKVKAGYLYTFLKSKFGLPMVTGGTFGSIIVHIEAENISDLLVPRLGVVEDQVHEMIQQAVNAQVESAELRKQAGGRVNHICGFPEKLAPGARIFAYSSASSMDVLRRLDATFHNPIAQQADSLTVAANGISLSAAGVSGYESNRMKQVFVEEGYGTPFITSGGIFSKTITPERYLRNQLLGDEETWRINENDTLVARSGQVGGIIGRGVWADSRLDGFAASPHILRLRPTSEEFPPGFVYAFLCLTDVGYQLLARTAAGSSIPFLPLNAVLEIKIPTKPSIQERNEIDELVKRSGELRKHSQKLEMEAVALVERTIEAGGR